MKERAVQSQEREGLTDPLWEETPEQWEQRLGLIREHLTDFYFAYNLPGNCSSALSMTLWRTIPGEKGAIPT